MYDQCGPCGFVFERAQGYFVWAIYVNYIVTIGLSLIGFLAVERWTAWTSTAQLMACSLFSIVFPLAFFRYSRSLWLSVEYLVNPDAG